MIKDLIEKSKTLDIYEKRTISDEYFEIVFLNTQTDIWLKIIEEEMGTPKKPKGTNPSKDDLSDTAKFCGISKGQVLYKKMFGVDIVLVMLWPWQDGAHTTLKAALVKV